MSSAIGMYHGGAGTRGRRRATPTRRGAFRGEPRRLPQLPPARPGVPGVRAHAATGALMCALMCGQRRLTRILIVSLFLSLSLSVRRVRRGCWCWRRALRGARTASRCGRGPCLLCSSSFTYAHVTTSRRSAAWSFERLPWSSPPAGNACLLHAPCSGACRL
jgi:hypothetical protein